MLRRLAALLGLSLGVVCLVLPEQHQAPLPDDWKHQQDWTGGSQISRAQRQTTPAARRPGVLQTLWQLVFGTAKDTRRAIANLTDMIQTNLIPNLQFEDLPSTPPTTPAAPNASTTEKPYRITRQEFLDIVRRNLYGLVRLFNREYRLAINDSRQNAVKNDEELLNALRPYFT